MLVGDLPFACGALQLSKASCERLEAVLVAVRQGAVGLAQRLQPFNAVLGTDDDDEEVASSKGAPDSADTLSLLITCERRLGTMLDIISKATSVSASQPFEDSSFFVTTSSPVCARTPLS